MKRLINVAVTTNLLQELHAALLKVFTLTLPYNWIREVANVLLSIFRRIFLAIAIDQR